MKVTEIFVERSTISMGYILEFAEEGRGTKSVRIPGFDAAVVKGLVEFIEDYRKAIERNHEK